MLATVAHAAIQVAAHAAHLLAFLLPATSPPPPLG